MKTGIWKRVLIVCVCMILVFIESGCSDFEIEPTKKVENQKIVGVVTKSSSSEYWMSVSSGMEAAAKKYNMKVIILSPDSELKKDVQEKQVEKLIEKNVDALAISPIDSYNMPEYMNIIKHKNIPTVTFDTGFEDADFPYIGIDNRKIGYELAKQLAEAMGHQGQVGIIAGDLNQSGHRKRVEGFQDYMSQEPDITIGFIESGYSNLQMSEQKVRTLLQEYPEVKGILTTSAVTALGLVDAMGNANIQIASVDEQEDSLEALEKGKIAVLAAQSGYDIGYETIQNIYEMLQGKQLNGNIFLKAEILTKDNLEEYRNEQKQK